MKPRIKRIINEARIQRTIDSKIWASMSSSSSKNRSTLGVDVKPRSKDDKQTLLQKYVAGLLTMKVECPKTAADINRLKAYKLIGNAALNAGVTLQEIQKLYVENGGSFDGEIDMTDEPEVGTSLDEPVKDYPDYDDVDIDVDKSQKDHSQNADDINVLDLFGDTDKEIIDKTVPNKKTDFDMSVQAKLNKQQKEYPDYDDVEIIDFSNASAEQVRSHFITAKKSLLRANKGDTLYWSNEYGLNLHAGIEIAKCGLNTYDIIDKKPRFVIITDNTAALGNNGNNGVYDDYRYTIQKNYGGSILVKPRTTYYVQEETKGRFYTDILIDNGNTAASQAVNVIDTIEIDEISSKTADAIREELKKNAYLPTLPELSKISKMLSRGSYWTSSVDDDGTSNIILNIKPDGVSATSNSGDVAKVVTFISF